MTEPSDEFISALLCSGNSVDLDVDSAFVGVTRRVHHVRRRRVALFSGAACIALLGGVVFAGSRVGGSDHVQPGGTLTDLRGNLIPDSSTTTSPLVPTTAVVPPPAATTTEATETLVVADDLPVNTIATPAGRSHGASPTTTSDDESAPDTTDNDVNSDDDDSVNVTTTSDGADDSHDGGSGPDESGPGGESERYDGGRSDGNSEFREG